MWAPEVEGEEEGVQGAWWCLVWVDTPYPSGRSPWTSGTVRGQKRGGGCCRPRGPPPSGRTQPQRAPTASRSTSPRPRLDFERKTVGSPCPPPHPPSPTLTSHRSRPAPTFGFPAGRSCLSATHGVSISSLSTSANPNIFLIKHAMTAILVSWNLDILLTPRPRHENGS